MGKEKYKITFISYLEGAREQELIVVIDYLIEQLNTLYYSGYKILKVKLIEQ